MNHGHRALRAFFPATVFALLLPYASGTQAAEPAPIPAKPFAERLAAADAVHGRVVFGRCRTCHYPDKGAGHQNGPSLWNVWGRTAGTQEGFAYYSQALKDSGLVWSPEILDAWLADPRGFIPGNMMMSLGVPDPQDRADLIAYLMRFREQENRSPPR